MKRTLSLLLAAALSLGLLAGCGRSGSSSSGSSQPEGSGGSSSSSSSQERQPAEEIDFMVLNGPTGVGASWLLDNYSLENAPEDAPFALNATVVADNSEVTAALINRSADIAALSTNVAANLSAKSDGGIQVLAVNTLGVLYILEKGDSVQSMADLAGKTLLAPSTGKGANPEYILNYLLEQSGVDPAQVDIQWMTPQEITAQMTTSEAGICMLPVPAATALLLQDSGVRQALSLSEEWDKLERGSLPMGCIVARTEFVEEKPELVESFLDLYEDSISFMSDPNNLEEAAALAARQQITASEAVAQAAIPQCNLTFVTGEEMKNLLEQYYSVLFQANPDSIGGSLPYDSFYYGVG